MTTDDDVQTWNTLQVEIVAQDRMLRSLIGPAATTRDHAHAHVQRILDEGVAAVHGNPALAARVQQIAEKWRQGAKDDTVSLGTFVHAIYPCQAGQETAAAIDWLSDFAATMRSAGVQVTVAQPRQQPPSQDAP